MVGSARRPSGSSGSRARFSRHSRRASAERRQRGPVAPRPAAPRRRVAARATARGAPARRRRRRGTRRARRSGGRRRALFPTRAGARSAMPKASAAAGSCARNTARQPKLLGQPPAGDRAERGGQGEAAGDPGLEAAALAWRHRFADDRHGEGVEAAAGGALQQPAGDQPAEGAGGGGDRAARGVQAERDQQQPAAAERVAELAADRRGHGGGDEVGDDHPGDALHRAERPGDGGQRGGDDGLVDGADDDGGGDGREGAEEGGAQLRRGHSVGTARRRSAMSRGLIRPR